jgi:tetratricopeptide (TPR) repeat protein
LSGATYFQIVDVESEQQGFLTYDRAVAKVPVAEIERLNAKLVPRAKNYAQATEGYSVADADSTPEPKRYGTLVAEFRAGRRDAAFLQRLALMAIRQKDTAQATAASDAFVKHAPQPYTREFWQAVLAITQTSKDDAFKLLRNNVSEVNATLGAQEAEKKLLEVIQRELITPYFKDPQRKQGWKDFEASVAAEHGDLGREAVYGAQMMEALMQENWVSFGNSYARYYETATPRSLYAVHALAYQVLKHVSDTRVLQSAIQVMKWQLDSPRESPIFGRYDPTELDTYANLLHKIGRTSEALDWQQKAVALTDGRDPEIVANLQRMKDTLQTSLRN